jgi:hypothetical protein
MCGLLDEYGIVLAAWLLVTTPVLLVSGFVVWAIVRISDNERAFTGDQIDGDVK